MGCLTMSKRKTNKRYTPKFKKKEPAACNSQTTSPFGCLNNFCFEILSNFSGSLQIKRGGCFFVFGKNFNLMTLPLSAVSFFADD